MNNDLISREWLKDAFDNLCCHDCKNCRNFRNEDSFYKCNLLENAPTVEPRIEYGTDRQAYKLFISGGQVIPDMLQGCKYEERPTGHWIKVADCYCWHWECENCHRRPLRTSTGHDDLSNFCPNCGADMRKD